jgi:MFS family permease
MLVSHQQSPTLFVFRTFGQFAAGMVDGIFVELLPDSGWRLMLGLAAIPSIIMYFGFQSLPESPRWLAMRGHVDQAAEVLRTLRETEQDAADEMAEIMDSIARNETVPVNGDAHGPTCNDDEEDNDLNDDDDPASTEYGSAPRPRHYQHHHHRKSQIFLDRLGRMLTDRAARKALFLGCGLMMIQQFSGINTYVFVDPCTTKEFTDSLTLLPIGS